MPDDKDKIITDLKAQLKAVNKALVDSTSNSTHVELEDMTNNIKAGVAGKNLCIQVNLAKPDKGENPEIVASANGSVGDNEILVKIYKRGRTNETKV